MCVGSCSTMIRALDLRLGTLNLSAFPLTSWFILSSSLPFQSLSFSFGEMILCKKLHETVGEPGFFLPCQSHTFTTATINSYSAQTCLSLHGNQTP